MAKAKPKPTPLSTHFKVVEGGELTLSRKGAFKPSAVYVMPDGRLFGKWGTEFVALRTYSNRTTHNDTFVSRISGVAIAEGKFGYMTLEGHSE